MSDFITLVLLKDNFSNLLCGDRRNPVRIWVEFRQCFRLLLKDGQAGFSQNSEDELSSGWFTDGGCHEVR